MRRFFASTVLLVLLAIVPRAAAQFVWTGSGTDGILTNAANWTTSAPTGSGTENLSFGDFAGSQTTVLVPTFAVNNLTFTGTNRPLLTFGGHLISGPPTLTLNGNISMSEGAFVIFDSTLSLSLSAGAHTIDIAGVETYLFMNSALGGTGSLVKTGSGILQLGYTSTYSGGTTIRAGSLVISGIQASVTHNAADLLVGFASGDLAHLSVLDHADVTNRIGYLGASGSSGSALVYGSGSTWTNTNYLYVGLTGTGDLQILQGGLVTSPNTSVGNNVGGTGTISIFDSGSSLVNSSTLYVGSEGHGFMNLFGGGLAHNVTGVIANNAGGVGAVDVQGAGSAWTNTGALLVGGSGFGSLSLQLGGVVSSASGTIGANANSTGSVSITHNSSAWTISSGLVIGSSGSGILSIGSGGRLNVASGEGTITLGASPGGIGSLNILTSPNPALIQASTITTGSGSGTLTFAGNATAGAPYHLTNDGTSSGSPITIAGPTVVSHLSGNSVISGFNSYTGGTLIAGGTLFAGGSFNTFGTGNVTVSSGATLGLAGAYVSNAIAFLSGSRLIGNGTIVNGSIGAGVTLAPGTAGAPIGLLAFEDLTLGGNSVFELNVQYNGSSFINDAITVENSATLTILATPGSPFTLRLVSLDGTGAPGLLGGVTPGTTYTLHFLDTNGVSGDFTLGSNFIVDSTHFQTGGPVNFSLTRTGNDYALNFTPVPEPSTWALLGLGVVAFAIARLRGLGSDPSIRSVRSVRSARSV